MARKSANRSSAIKRVLAIDIGGTGLKAAIIGPQGAFLEGPLRIETPAKPKPAKLVAALTSLVKPLKNYDHVSIGFPGYVRDGRIYTAPHLGTKDWADYPLEKKMRTLLKKPVRLLNDADVQGLAVIRGKGLEIVCTLGTGFGTAMFQDGKLLPHMDLAHMATHKHHDFDDWLGDVTLKKIGRKAWNKRLQKTVAMLEQVFFYDHLYLGGGNSRHISFKLPRHVSIVSNNAGMEGGAFVWHPRTEG